jgi:hypothetical protein
VIAYFIVTSLINLSLGYALAVYVGRARLRTVEADETPMPGESPRDASVDWPSPAPAAIAESEADALAATDADDRRTEERSSTWLANDDAPSLAPSASPAVAAAAAAAVSAGEPATASETLMMEKDLLAGIEEFRLQLAKIKGHAEGEPLAEALGVSLAGK